MTATAPMSTESEFALLDRAIGVAARAHAGQTRKRSKMPYVAHPFGVAFILQRMGCPGHIVIAGLLHDTVEDTALTLEEIRDQFGDDVAEIVALCSEPQGLPWEVRKQAVLERVATAPLPAKLVIAADKYHNLFHVKLNKQQLGDRVWDRFSRGVGQQAWYYRSIVVRLRANNKAFDQYAVFGRLRTLVDELFAGIPSEPPDTP